MTDRLRSRLCKLLVVAVVSAASAAVAASADRGSHSEKSSSDSGPDQELIITGRDALRRIVQEHCLVHWTQKHDPSPCERVILPDSKSERAGYAVLADQKGGAHYLLVPTQTITGYDSDELLDPDLPNYFAEAWRARDLITAFVGHEVPRTAVGLAINTAHSRSQDQFHIHIECLRPDVAESLSGAASRVTDTWSPVVVAGSTYQAQRVLSDGLDGSNLFEMLAKLKPEVRHHLSDYTLLVAGMRFKEGPGFIVLTGTGPTAELMLDSGCSVAGAGG
jgi:CDP-diacylglycerol pyrophosphatase